MILHNLGVLRNSLRYYAAAEALLRRALSIREQRLGPDHPTVASSLNSLAAIHWNQGRVSKAELLWRRSLGIVEQAQPAEYSVVMEILNRLAALYIQQRKYSKAEPLLRRLSASQEKLSDRMTWRLPLDPYKGVIQAGVSRTRCRSQWLR